MNRTRSHITRRTQIAFAAIALAMTALSAASWLLSPDAPPPGTILAGNAWAAEAKTADRPTTATAPALPAPGGTGLPNDAGTAAIKTVFSSDPLRTLAQSLQDKQRELDEKEQQLKQTEQRLEAMRKEVEQNLTQIELVYKQMQKAAGQADEQQKAELKKWVKIYEAMAPEQAGQVLQDLDVELAKSLLASMDPKKAGKILNTIPSEKAVRLGEKVGSSHP